MDTSAIGLGETDDDVRLLAEKAIFKIEAESAKVEAEEVSPAQKAADASALGALADRLLSGAAAPYLGARERTRALAISEWAKRLALSRGAPSVFVPSEAHVETHLEGPRKLVDEVERAVVLVETEARPIFSPDESETELTSSIVAVLAAAAIGYLLISLAG